MKKQILKTLVSLYFLMLIFIAQVFADTIPDGSIVYGTWDIANSPYVIMGEVEVPADCTLIIEAGVRVELLSSTDYSVFNYNNLGVGLMFVYGRVFAEGTVDDSITFTRTGEGNWGSIFISNSQQGPNILKFCHVVYGNSIYNENEILYHGGVMYNYSNGIIENSLFEHNTIGLSCTHSSIHLSECVATENDIGFSVRYSTSIINGNWIHNNNHGISSYMSSSHIKNNTIENCWNGIVSNGSLDTIHHNTIRNNDYVGINLMDNNSLVHNNIVYGSNSGIRCNHQPFLINNTIINNFYFGVYCDDNAAPIILNSIIYGNQHLVTLFDYDSVVLANCLVQVDTLPEGILDGGGNIYNQEPCFADTSNNDFSLAMNSPCIDMGTPFFVWENDTIVNLSPDEYYGNAPDMGAVESLFTNINIDKQDNELNFLYQNYPNPTSSSTIIRVKLESQSNGMLEIINLSGKLIFSSEIIGKGEHSVTWDGLDSNGCEVNPGVYISVLKCGGNQYWKPMILTD